MPFRIGRLALWFAFGYFVLIRLRELVMNPDPAGELAEYADPHLLLLKIASGVVFFSYTIGQYLLLRYGHSRFRWYFLLLAEIVLVIACMLFRSFVDEVVVKAITGSGNYNPDMTWTNYFLDNLYYAIVFSSIGIIFYFVQLARHNDEARLESETLQRETELKFLRSQVNPHFLFNTLNNLYSLVNAKSEQSLPALEKLSGLLRYSLYEQEATVPLDREISYLHDLIHLESLRVPNLTEPEVEIGPFATDWQLPPLLLVPFVENAFKHGELTNPDDPLAIRVTEQGDRLLAVITNPIRRQRTSVDAVGGIGLENVRKRLSLLYPERHGLAVASENDRFTVRLWIRKSGG